MKDLNIPFMTHTIPFILVQLHGGERCKKLGDRMQTPSRPEKNAIKKSLLVGLASRVDYGQPGKEKS